MPAWTWWVVVGSGVLLVSVLAALVVARFIGFGESTPTDREVQ